MITNTQKKFGKTLKQSNTILPADVFENFRNKCIEIYELNSVHLLFTQGLAQTCSSTKRLVGNLNNKKEYIMHIRTLKQASNHGLVCIG